jgi:hypothetical protein
MTATRTGLLALLCNLDAHGVQPIWHGEFVGLRGQRLSRVPQRLRDLIDQEEPALLRHLRQEPSPFRRRQEGVRGR